MADAKISALTAVATPAAADELAVNQAGVSKKATLQQLADYALGAGRLQVGSYDNLIQDPTFQLAIGTAWQANTGWSIDTTGSRAGGRALLLTHTSGALDFTFNQPTLAIKVEAGQVYRFTTTYKTSVITSDSTVVFSVQTRDTAGADGFVTVAANVGNTVANAWGIITGTFTVPANVVAMNPYLNVTTGGVTGSYRFDSVQVTRVADALLIADGYVTNLPAVTTPAPTDEISVAQGGVSKKLTLSQVNAFVDPASNASVAAQTLGTGDTYLAGSNVGFLAGRIKAGSFYRAVFDMVKTAAGVATATMTLRMGTAGTTADAAVCTFTFPSAQTAAIDNARFTVMANVRTAGAGTSATVEGVLIIERTNTTTGFLSTSALQFMAPIRVLSSGFNSTTVTTIGLSINAGASSAWTTQLVQADVKNLV